MKIKIHIILTALLLTLSCSCTQNDGDIGIFFGTWANTSFTIDGEAAPDFDTNTTTWNFQSNIIMICKSDEYHQGTRRYGTWKDLGDRLQFDFSHSDAATEAGTSVYAAPEWLDFPKNTTFEFRYVEKSGRRIVLERTGDNGIKYTYTLNKTW